MLSHSAHPRTLQAAFAMLFPSEKKASPTRAEHATNNLDSLTFTLTDNSNTLTATGCPGSVGQVRLAC